MKIFRLLAAALFVPFVALAQPLNDNCPGQTVTDNGACVTGTTVAATDSWTNLVGCQAGPGGPGGNHPDVWYNFIATNSILSATITAQAGWAGTIEVTLFEPSALGCAGLFTELASTCGLGSVTLSATGLIPGNDYVIVVSNPQNGTPGQFEICTETTAAPVGCVDNDNCADAQTIALPASGSGQICLNDCNTGAAPGLDWTGVNCFDQEGPTVWYEFTTDALQALINVTVTSSDFATPEFSIWENSCGPWTFMTNTCVEGSGGVATLTDYVGLLENTTYLIAIGDANGGTGNFTLCIEQSPDTSPCNTNSSITETGSSNPTTPVGGPYAPGEVVSFCYNITDWQTGPSCNYLQGIVPTFGNGWAASSFNAQGMPVNITTPLATAGTILDPGPGPPTWFDPCVGDPAGTWSWYPAGAVVYNNLLANTGSPGALPDGTPLPAGWFFTSSYDPINGNCNNPVDPDLAYGDNNFPYCNNTLDWNVCFNLTAGPAANCTSGNVDLSISIQTYADGEIGAWNSVGCVGNIPQTSNGALQCCPIFNNPGPQTVCDSYQFPVIGGSLLTGSEAYYTGPNGTGTVYNAGDVVNWASFGAYPVTLYIYDLTSCGTEVSFQLTIGQTPSVTYTAPSDLCINAGIQNGLGGGTPAGGVYSGPGVTDNGNGTTYSFNPLTAGAGTHNITYTVVTLPNPPGCSSFATDNIQVFPLPVLTFTAPADLCINAGIQAGLGGATPAGGVYSGPGVTDNGNGTTYSFNPATAGVGTHTITYTYTNANGCTNTITDNIQVFALPVLTFTALADLCINAGVQSGLAGATPSGGVFSGPGVTNTGNGVNYSFNPATAGVGTHTITYTLTNANGCTNAITDNVQVFALPVLSFTAPADLCIDAGIQNGLGGATPTGGVYSGPGVTNAGNGLNYSFNPATAGVGTHTITYTYTNANSCTNTITDNIQVFPLPVLTFTAPADLCIDAGVQAGLGGATPVGGVYSGPGVTDNGNGTTYSFNPATAGVGTHTITYTYTNTNSCTNAITDNVIVNPLPIISGTLSVCVNAQTDLSATNTPAVSNPWVSSNPAIATVDVNGLVTGIGAGSVDITYTDINGCTDVVSVTINPNPVISLTPQNPTSCGGDDGQITVNGSGTGTVAWSITEAGSNSPVALPYTIMNLSAGSYSVIFTNTTTGCVSNTGLTTLNNPFAPIIDAIGDTSSCEIDFVVPDPLLFITGSFLSGNQAFYSASGGNPANLIAQGTSITAAMSPFTVYVYDSNGSCDNEISFVVDVNTNPIATVSPDPAALCEGNTLSLNGTPSLGSGVYASHNWTGDIAILNATNVVNPTVTAATPSGTYNLTYTVTDNNGCSGSDGIQVVVNPYPTAVPTTLTPSICDGDDVLLQSNLVLGGTYVWSGPNGFTSGVQNPSIVGATTAATGTYSLTITQNGCTSAASTVDVTVNPYPVAVASTTTPTICEGDDIVLQSNLVLGGTYDWSGPNGFTSGVQNPSIIGAAVAATGTYSLTITQNGCTSTTSTVDVTVNPYPTALASTTTPAICEGDDILLQSNLVLGGTYDWSGPNGFTSGVQNPSIVGATTAATGTYTLTITQNGCTSTASTVDVTVNPYPTALASTTTPAICEGDDILLQSNLVLGGTYDWSGPNGFTSGVQNPSIIGATVAATGTYSLTITQNGCTSAASTVDVTVNPYPTALASTTTPTICEGDDIVLQSNLVLGGTYDWSGPNGFTSGVQNPSIVGAMVAATGTYSLTITQNGCTSVASAVDVQVTPYPTAIATTTTPAICEGQDILLGSNLVVGGVYDWTGPNGFSNASQNPTIAGATVLNDGTYSLTISVNGCTSAIVFVDVSVIPSPVLDVVSDVNACDSYLLPVIQGTNLTGNQAYYNNSQALGGTVISGSLNSSQTVWVYDGNGACSSEQSFDVTITPTDDASFTLSDFCEGNALGATVIGSPGGTFTFNPSPGDGATIDAATGLITNGIGGTSYTVVYTTAGACPSSSNAVIDVLSIPTAAASTTTNDICSGLDLLLFAENVSGASYSWSGPNGFASNSQNPVIDEATIDAEGTYTLTVTLNGCLSTPATLIISMKECEIIVPTAITPGQDPNSVWELINLDERYPDNSVRIYNRWGNIIFEHKSDAGNPYYLNPWDGTNQENGQLLPVASYYFVIDYNDGSGEGESGTVTIVKN